MQLYIRNLELLFIVTIDLWVKYCSLIVFSFIPDNFLLLLTKLCDCC